MPSSARHISTMYVVRRVDLGIGPYGFAVGFVLVYVSRQPFVSYGYRSSLLLRQK